MVESADSLLPLAILVFATLIALVVIIVHLVRSGPVPILTARGGDAAKRSGAKP